MKQELDGSEIDHVFAEQFGKDEKEKDFLAEMMKRAREGHLCLQRKEPFVGNFVEEVGEETEWFGKLVGKWDDLYYLQRNWVLEARVVKELKRLLRRHVKRLDLKNDQGLNTKQREACIRGLSESVLCLSGGPGTGKTYTVGRIVEEYLDQEEGDVILAAPTGKAVGQLKARLEGDRVEVGTLHALLKVRKAEDVMWNKSKLRGTLLIVDECSMIDVTMWAALLSAIDDDMRLVLVGDHDQLPPVEAGTVYGEICRYMQGKEGYVHLDECMRIEQGEILEWAKCVQQGKVGGFALGDKIEIEKWTERFPKPEKGDLDLEKIFGELKKFRVLTCLRRGPWGVEALNEQISRYLRDSFRGGCVWPMPILVTKTDYELGIFNGDIGVLLKRSGAPFLEKGDVVVFEGEGEYRTLPAVLLPGFEFAYALSVHKSQGSEYDEVVLIVPKGSEVFGREILYTGITRARQKLEIIGESDVIESCVAQSGEKLSGIRRRLKE